MIGERRGKFPNFYHVLNFLQIVDFLSLLIRPFRLQQTFHALPSFVVIGIVGITVRMIVALVFSESWHEQAADFVFGPMCHWLPCLGGEEAPPIPRHPIVNQYMDHLAQNELGSGGYVKA